MSTTIQTPYFQQTTQNPIQEIISGMINGAQLHAHLTAAQDEHEASQRQAIQQQRENSLADIQQKMQLASNTRPVENGAVADTGPDGSSIMRKVDAARRLRYTDANGESVDRELYTPEEQLQKAVKSKAALQNAGNQDIPIPAELQGFFGGKASLSVAPHEVPALLNDLSKSVHNVVDFPVPPDVQKRQGVGATLKGPEFDRIMGKDADERRAAAKEAADAAKAAEKEAADAKKAAAQQAFTAGENDKNRKTRLQAAGIAASGGGGGSALSDEALENAARAVSSGMPVMQAVPGMGKAATALRTKVLNRVAELKKDGGGFDQAGASAGFKADSASLNTLQKSRDQVNAFESTAGKNLDQFLQTAKKVVDSGSPLINQPIRGLALKLAGSPDQAAFNTARQVAVTEIAKVLSNPGLSGQLSDSARHEVQDLIGPDATLNQIYRAAGILKTDMKNRRESMDSQISEIKGRISGGNKGGEAPKATKRFNPATGQIEEIK